MTRLVLPSVLLVACSGGDVAPPPARTAGVAAAKADDRAVEGFCEVTATADTARPFVAPPLDGGAALPPSKGWRWVNVWATWCGPCIAELPTLQKWHERLASSGHPTELVLLSVDDTADVLKRFYDKHPGHPDTLRVTSASVVPDWLTANGLEPGSAVPLHFFLDPEGRTRCVRTGAVDPGDYAVVERIVGG